MLRLSCVLSIILNASYVFTPRCRCCAFLFPSVSSRPSPLLSHRSSPSLCAFSPCFSPGNFDVIFYFSIPTHQLLLDCWFYTWHSLNKPSHLIHTPTHPHPHTHTHSHTHTHTHIIPIRGRGNAISNQAEKTSNLSFTD